MTSALTGTAVSRTTNSVRRIMGASRVRRGGALVPPWHGGSEDPPLRTRGSILPRMKRTISFAICMVVVTSLLQAQPRSPVATDPDVLAAQRLFTVWLEGQMLSRHLPGIAVGVVADQELIWSKG